MRLYKDIYVNLAIPINAAVVAEWMEPWLRILMILTMNSDGMLCACGRMSSRISWITWRSKITPFYLIIFFLLLIFPVHVSFYKKPAFTKLYFYAQ